MKPGEPRVTGMDVVGAAGLNPDLPQDKALIPQLPEYWLLVAHSDSFSGQFPQPPKGKCLTQDHSPSHRQLTSNDWSYTDTRASPAAHTVKNLLHCRRPRFDFWARKIPWRREW